MAKEWHIKSFSMMLMVVSNAIKKFNIFFRFDKSKTFSALVMLCLAWIYIVELITVHWMYWTNGSATDTNVDSLCVVSSDLQLVRVNRTQITGWNHFAFVVEFASSNGDDTQSEQDSGITNGDYTEEREQTNDMDVEHSPDSSSDLWVWVPFLDIFLRFFCIFFLFLQKCWIF